MSANAYSECIGGGIVSTDSTVSTSKRLVTTNKPGRVGLLLHNCGTVDLWYDFNSSNTDGSVSATSKAGTIEAGKSVPLPLGDDVYLKGRSSDGSTQPYCVREW